MRRSGPIVALGVVSSPGTLSGGTGPDSLCSRRRHDLAYPARARPVYPCERLKRCICDTYYASQGRTEEKAGIYHTWHIVCHTCWRRCICDVLCQVRGGLKKGRGSCRLDEQVMGTGSGVQVHRPGAGKCRDGMGDKSLTAGGPAPPPTAYPL
jgi:hypothetical protein